MILTKKTAKQYERASRIAQVTLSFTIEMQGMIAENRNRSDRGESIAYPEYAFDALGDRFENAIKEIEDKFN